MYKETVNNHKLIKAFNEMDKMPIIEIEDDNGDFRIYNIVANNNIIGTQTYNNGFFEMEWDFAFSLDEHLQELYEVLQDDREVK